jgi:hypothetical protein
MMRREQSFTRKNWFNIPTNGSKKRVYLKASAGYRKGQASKI